MNGIEYDPVMRVWTLTEEYWKSSITKDTPKEDKYEDYYGLQIKVD